MLREGYFSSAAQQKMLLSKETLLGLKITGMYAVAIAMTLHAMSSMQLAHFWSLYQSYLRFLE